MDPDIQRPANNNAGGFTGGSVDGFRPVSAPRSPTAQNQNVAFGGTQAPVGDPRIESAMQALKSTTVKTKSGKGLKIVLALFIILFLAALGGAGYLYMQYDTTKSDLATEKATAASLRTQLSSVQAAADLATQNGETALEEQTDYAASLNAVATQLKTKCGSACSAITIPTAPQ